MNIPNLKYNNNKTKKINLTSNNNTPQRLKRFSFSNSLTSQQTKSNCRNRKEINDNINCNFSFNNIKENLQQYIFNNYKVSPLIAILIYEKAINKLFSFIRKSLPKNIFLQLKKKYILYVVEELHINNNIISNISDKELIDSNIKLFITHKTSHFLNYNKFIDRCQFKLNNNSNSSFQLNKIKLRKGKLTSFSSFNTEVKATNKSLINSSKIFIRPKNKLKNICNTEYNTKVDKEKIKNKKEISQFKPLKIKRNDITNHLKNISMTSQLVFPNKKSLKNSYAKEKATKKEKNSENKIIKLPINKIKKTGNEKNKKEIKEEEKGDGKNTLEKENEKNSIKQLNLIKENLDENLKNMFNFSYGNFLNNERESESSKSLHDIYNFYKNEGNNIM